MIKFVIIFSVAAVLLIAAACNSGGTVDTGKAIHSAQVNDMTVVLSNREGALKQTDGTFMLTFKDNTGKPVDVGAASLKFYMPPMGPMMAMNAQATLMTTDTPGVYHGSTKFEMSGEWQAQIVFDGPKGKGQTSFSVMVQ